jgi:ABC-type phosphate transport system substrate-binding protein
MTTLRALARQAVRIGAALGLASLGLAVAAQPAGASTYTSISGSGSSWASVALDQWSSNVRQNGLVVNYNPDGSASGRQDYINNQVDFTGSDPPFRNGQDELGGTGAENSGKYGFSYVPDTAGGTAFMYHLTVAGHLITNLRLAPLTIMKIFTGNISNWDDKRITRDYGKQLPNLPITPVVRSDGSGATYFLTRWMEHLDPSLWNAFCQRVHPGIKLPCPQTEFYPPNFGNAKAENGSTNVANYITSSYGNGAIGYDEYAYALNSHYPVVAVLNPAGYYVLPSASNVAVALTKARINEDPHSQNFLQQNLDAVYTFKDPRSYPLSSYSYLIVPRQARGSPSPPPEFSSPAGKGRSLSTFIDYFLCAGQAHIAELGYSPLPLKLVQGGLLQTDQIPGAVRGPNLHTLAGCANPTFTNGVLTLLKNAPFPSPCQKVGEPLNCVVKNGKATTPGSGGSGSGKKAGASATAPAGTVGGTGTGTGTSTGTGTGATGGQVTGQVINLAASQSSQAPLAVVTALGILAAVATPPALAAWLRRRRRA